MKPVLVDTSVWRRYFAGDDAAQRLGELLDEDSAVLTHPWVLGELVLGGLSQREERLLERLPTATVVPHAEVMEFVRRRRLMRRGIGWVDVNLLASALTAFAALWTFDGDLARAAEYLGISFE